MKQLRLTRPARRANAERLTERQDALLGFLRWQPPRSSGRQVVGIEVDALAERLGYKDVRRACDRLVRRGLVLKVMPGVYVARVLRERKA